MMAITTSSSMSVKPFRTFFVAFRIILLLEEQPATRRQPENEDNKKSFVPYVGSIASLHFDFVGQDWQARILHRGMLRELLGVNGLALAAQNHASGAKIYLQLADAAAESASQQAFQSVPIRVERQGALSSMHVFT
jgi:hypothetical protein